MYQKLKKNTKAEEHFLKVLELEPLHQEAILNLGYLHYAQKNFTEVIRSLKKLPESALFSSPKYVQAGSMLVNSHIQLGDLREAEELFKIMLDQDSQQLQVDALNGLGNL